VQERSVSIQPKQPRSDGSVLATRRTEKQVWKKGVVIDWVIRRSVGPPGREKGRKKVSKRYVICLLEAKRDNGGKVKKRLVGWG